MTRSQLQSAVIQSTILIALSMIISNEISRHAYDTIWDDPVFKNFTTAFSNITANSTSSNTTSATGKANLTEANEAFYIKSFPRSVFIYFLLCPLHYYWQIYLERFFPARPRGVEIDYEKENVKEGDVNEGQEEEVVKRWIAQGKVRRSSVSWWNTFVKWVLDVTIGKLWALALRHVVDGFIRWHSLAQIFGSLKSYILFGVFSSFLSIVPVTLIIGLVVVPAHKRVVFEAGIYMVENVFVSAFFRLAIPWAIHTELVQQMLGNATEGMMKTDTQVSANAASGRFMIGGPDEL